jgi:carbamoyl-phosphate synthase large subunit
MNTFNILFTSVGRRVNIVQYFRQVLKSLELTGNIVTVDLHKHAPASFLADFTEQVCPVTNSKYVSQLLDICAKYQIKLLIPLIDTELHLLSLHKQDFAEIGVTVLVSSAETNEICMDKRKTFTFFKSIGVQTPEIYDYETIIADKQAQYPFLIKPYNGSSSNGVTIVKNSKELEFFKDYIPNAIIQEFVIGQEYTLDILVDFQGQVQMIVPRKRIETRAGEISKGMTVKNYDLIHAGKIVVSSLKDAIGCITVQCFLQPDGEIKFIEINPRFGGGFPLSYQAGANFPRLILEMMLGKKYQTAIDNWQENIVMLRYDEAIFVNREAII